jgi:hypothetical protein
MLGNNQDAKFTAILGATGCGKTTELKKRLAKIPKKRLRRTFVWSPKEKIDNYQSLFHGSVYVRSAGEVLAALKKARAESGGGFHLVFVPTLNRKKDTAMFDIVCRMLMAVGNLVLIVDELHTVTLPSWSPDGWANVNFMGRGFGLEVFGLSQRPASVDKDFLANLSGLHVGRMSEHADAMVCAKKLGVHVSEVAALTGYQAIQKNMLNGEITRVG